MNTALKHCFKVLSILSLTIYFSSCKPTAESIIQDAIKTHGGDKYEHFEIALDFRDKHYVLKNQNGKYEYLREQIDSSGHKIIDIITNDTFERKIENEVVTVPDSMASKFRNSINSVAYFFLLPKPLSDPAVNAELLGTIKLKGKEFFKIKVNFDKEGGGKDHEDTFIYWINKETKTLDYFAYQYATDGGGMRFREAISPKTQSGIKYCDYKNYGFDDLKNKLEDLDTLFEKNQIPLKSEIINLNVSIK